MTTVRTWLSADYECHGTDEGFAVLYEYVKDHFKPRNISTSYTVRSSFKNKEEAVRLGDVTEKDRGEDFGNDKIHNFVCEQQPEWELFLYKGWQPIFLKMKANDIHGNGKIVMIGPRCATAVKEILEQASKLQSISRNDETTTFRAQCGQWIAGKLKPQRTTDTVEIPAAEKSRLLKNVDFFVGTTRDKFYAKHGQAYRTGYLFYGPPGTGKTSCVIALAGRTSATSTRSHSWIPMSMTICSCSRCIPFQNRLSCCLKTSTVLALDASFELPKRTPNPLHYTISMIKSMIRIMMPPKIVSWKPRSSCHLCRILDFSTRLMGRMLLKVTLSS